MIHKVSERKDKEKYDLETWKMTSVLMCREGARMDFVKNKAFLSFDVSQTMSLFVEDWRIIACKEIAWRKIWML